MKSLTRTSTTGSLNLIKGDEEATKGWKKGDIALPYEFQDLNTIHIIPFVDLGRLLIVLVCRSVALSNTQYSLLLESGGRLINLGSEWIGARVGYKHLNEKGRMICYSGMLAPEDTDYTDYWGYNNDECDYFINGFATDDRIYLQSSVFDVTFELEMDFDLIELEFNQLNDTRKLHVSSNPNFAFHDDVFPSFAKNQVTQEKFSASVPDKITMIADNYFTKLTYFDHISTIMLDSFGIHVISFDLKMIRSEEESENAHSRCSAKILEFRLSSGENLLSLELLPTGSVRFSSILLDEKITLKKKIRNKEDSFMIEFNFLRSTISFYDPDQKKYNREKLRKKINNVVKFKKQAVYIYKYGQETAIKKLAIYISDSSRNFEDHMLLLFDGSGDNLMSIWKPGYILSGELAEYVDSNQGLIFHEPTIYTPAERES